MKFEAYHNAEEKARYKLVRTDTYIDIPGQIVEADEENGTCVLAVVPAPGEAAVNQSFNFGPHGFRVVLRRR